MMMRLPLPAVALLCASAAPAASLGVATAEGDFKLNNAIVRGNATLSEGALLETMRVPSRLQLPGGASLRLDAGSRVRVLGDRVVVETGSGDFRPASTYALESRTLRVEQETTSRLRFALAPGATGPVQLSAASGRLRVLNSTGTLVSRLEPGVALAFEPQARPADSSAPSSFIGCVVKKDSKFMLYDSTLRILVELRGSATAVEREWGNRVQANGTSPTAGQPEGRQVMDVTTITRIDAGGCGEMANAVNAEVPAQPSPASAPGRSVPRLPGGEGGMSAGTKYGIIAGVVGGGAIAGIAAAAGGDKRSR